MSVTHTEKTARCDALFFGLLDFPVERSLARSHSLGPRIFKWVCRKLIKAPAEKKKVQLPWRVALNVERPTRSRSSLEVNYRAGSKRLRSFSGNLFLPPRTAESWMVNRARGDLMATSGFPKNKETVGIHGRKTVHLRYRQDERWQRDVAKSSRVGHRC